MEKEPKNYSEAISEVEKILAEFNSGALDVDALAAKVRRATELIAWCKTRLTRAEKSVEDALKFGND